MSVSGNYPQGFRDLLNRLVPYKVTRWVAGGSTSEEVDRSADREVASLAEADVISSKRYDGRHAVVLDIDHPCYLVRSTTPGHYHLYIDVPGGIEGRRYMNLLSVMAGAGIIEDGYANASIERGATMVRLPWVKKPQDGAGPVGTPASAQPSPLTEPSTNPDPWPEVTVRRGGIQYGEVRL